MADKSGWVFPVIEKVEIMDHGARLGILYRDANGTLSAHRVATKDIVNLPGVRMRSNITAEIAHG